MAAPEKDRQDGKGPQDKLHIFVNRRKFDETDGVKSTMTGGEIAGLVNVPTSNATIKSETGSDQREIAETESVAIKMGDHFLVTRKIVEGGHGA